jgi:hypothetical protein
MRAHNPIAWLLAGAIAALLSALTIALLALLGTHVPLFLTPVLPAFAAGFTGMAGVALGWRLSGRTGTPRWAIIVVTCALSIVVALICGNLVVPLNSALRVQVFSTLAAIGFALPVGLLIGLRDRRQVTLRAALAVAAGPLYGLAFGAGFGFAVSRAYVPCSSPAICLGPNIGYVFGLVFGPIIGLWLGIILWLALRSASRMWPRNEPAAA